jgi:uncharacterized protein YbjT (DUF2867 family)
MTSSGFIAGATGFVGRYVVAQLVARGRRAIAHVRPDSSQLPHWRDHFATVGAEVDTTPWQQPAMTQRLLELRPDSIFVCIGTTKKRARTDRVSGNPYEVIDYGLTKLLVDASRQANTEEASYRPRLIYLSSLGADASARSAYLSWRGKAEDAVRSSGLPWMIAQPSFITESRDAGRDQGRPVERASAAIGDASLAVISVFGGHRLRSKYRSTTPEVLAAALIGLADDPDVNRVVSGDGLR